MDEHDICVLQTDNKYFSRHQPLMVQSNRIIDHIVDDVSAMKAPCHH